MERREVIVSRGELPDWTGYSCLGDGHGYGHGYGYGYGDGEGNGDGDGGGYGGGGGYAQLYQIVKTSWPRLAEIEDTATALALWKSDENGMATNGGRSKEAARPGLIEEIEGPLGICTARGLHATMNPEKYSGQRVWVVALFGEVQWQGDKCAALKREIIGELK